MNNETNKKSDAKSILIKEFYQDPKVGYISAKALHNKIKDIVDVSVDDIKSVLNEQKGYQQQQTRRRTYKTRSYFVKDEQKPFEQCSMDLIDMYPITNEKIYTLLVIDNLTRYIFLRYTKNKTAATTKEAFEDIKQQIQKMGFKLERVQSDDGNEFKGIKERFVNKNSKAWMAETAIRTIKQRMLRWLRSSDKKYLTPDILEKLAENYNNTKHSSIGMTPNEAVNNYEELRKTLIAKQNDYTPIPLKFQVGDIVRVSKVNRVFDKLQNSSWSDSLYIVNTAEQGNPNRFRVEEIVEDKSGVTFEDIDGWFYTEELKLYNRPE